LPTAADIEVAVRDGDGGAGAVLQLRVGIGDVSLEAEDEAGGLEVIADADAVEQAVRIGRARKGQAVIAAQSFNAKAGEGRGILRESRRGERGRGKRHSDNTLHDTLLGLVEVGRPFVVFPPARCDRGGA
jgi:hypothetical protein